MSKIIVFSTHDYTNYTITEEHLDILGDKSSIIKGELKHLNFLIRQPELMLDIETNFVDSITERVVHVVQFGTIDKKYQFIFDVAALTDEELEFLKKILSFRIIFYIHNAKFEYTIIKHFFNIDIRYIRDTYLLTKLLTNGLTLEKGTLSLKELVREVKGIRLDKGAQITFDGNKMSYEQLIYASLDVYFIEEIHEEYFRDLETWKMVSLYSLECNAVRAFGDMEVTGVDFDREYHQKNVDVFKTALDKSFKEIKSIIYANKEVVEYLENNKFIQKTDEYKFKWTSHVVTKKVLKLILPDIVTTNKVELKKYLKNNKENLSTKQIIFLNYFLNKEYTKVEEMLVSGYHQNLVDLGLFVKEGEFLLNLDSPDQRLKLFKFWYPDLKDTKEKTLRRKSEPIMQAYKKYIKVSKMSSSFGEKMYEHIEKDGKIHTNFTQLVTTGRVSSSKPNLQQMPSTSEFRNAFIAPEGWSFTGVDYSSQELYVAAQASGDEGYWAAIKEGLDLHSYSASLIFGDKWFKAGGIAKPKGKPKTPELKQMRTAAKSLSFSLLYGSSALSLSENLDIPHKEALKLMEAYFEVFPKLSKYMQSKNTFGVSHKYVRALPPFGRVRFFDTPRNKGEENSIGRKSQNFPIQGSSATMTKLALVYIKDYIEKKGLQDKVKIVLTVHDEILCIAHDSIAERWYRMQVKLMEKAANKIIPGNWLGVEGGIFKRWEK